MAVFSSSVRSFSILVAVLSVDIHRCDDFVKEFREILFIGVFCKKAVAMNGLRFTENNRSMARTSVVISAEGTAFLIFINRTVIVCLTESYCSNELDYELSFCLVTLPVSTVNCQLSTQLFLQSSKALPPLAIPWHSRRSRFCCCRIKGLKEVRAFTEKRRNSQPNSAGWKKRWNVERMLMLSMPNVRTYYVHRARWSHASVME